MDLKKLEDIGFVKNNIKNISERILRLQSLKKIRVSDNPLSEVSRRILKCLKDKDGEVYDN